MTTPGRPKPAPGSRRQSFRKNLSELISGPATILDPGTSLARACGWNINVFGSGARGDLRDHFKTTTMLTITNAMAAQPKHRCCEGCRKV